jgi:hypothetical protein
VELLNYPELILVSDQEKKISLSMTNNPVIKAKVWNMSWMELQESWKLL